MRPALRGSGSGFLFMWFFRSLTIGVFVLKSRPLLVVGIAHLYHTFILGLPTSYLYNLQLHGKITPFPFDLCKPAWTSVSKAT